MEILSSAARTVELEDRLRTAVRTVIADRLRRLGSPLSSGIDSADGDRSGIRVTRGLSDPCTFADLRRPAAEQRWLKRLDDSARTTTILAVTAGPRT